VQDVPVPELKVSVVVPVYNAGKYLELCAPSLLGQSLSPTEYEVIYVNDGSTDDSEARLAEICREYPNARFLSQPNSGWPGKPRNVGIEASQGRYIQFVDQDDELAPEALERMFTVGDRNGSDIVLGKMGGTMAKPNLVFRRNVEAGSVLETGAIDTLTGHKMFRREFLNSHQIRFPEGYWRMEDLLFVIRAYVRDPRISVVADYVCYWWRERDDGGNHSLAAFDFADHYRRLRVIIDTVRDTVPPGERQDEMLRRFYRVETLSQVGEVAIMESLDDSWRVALPHLSVVARECFTQAVRDGLPAARRLRGVLAEAEDAEALLTLSQRLVSVIPVIERRKVTPDADGSVRVRLGFWLAIPDAGVPAGSRLLSVVSDDGTWRLDPWLTDGIERADGFVAGDPLFDADGVIRLEDAERGVWWYPQGHLSPALETTEDGVTQVVVSGELRIDPAAAAAGGPLPTGLYTAWFVGQILGINRRRRVIVPKVARTATPRWSVSSAAAIVSRPGWSTRGGALTIEVRDRQEWLAEHLRAAPDAGEYHTDLILPVLVGARLPPDPVPVALSVADQQLVGQLHPGEKRGDGRLHLSAEASLPDGTHTLLVTGAFTFLGEVRVADGRLTSVAGDGLHTLAEAGPRPDTRPRPKPTPRRVVGKVLRRLGLRD
jgi:poly(ribitol-phosphate) beta-N-acetylglucosaminyltransferase